MALGNEQVIRKAYQTAEDKDVGGWIASFTDDGTFTDESIEVIYRDNHVRSAEFLDVENFPNITFRSTVVRSEGNRIFVDGELTIRGVTRPVTLVVEVNGFTPDHHGGTRVGFSANTEIDRQDFGVSYNGPIPGTDNAMVLSDKVTLNLEVQAVLQAGESAA
jgi:polyisoprenoid-binding protein YceI